MQRLAHGRIIDPEVARHRVDLAPLGGGDASDGALDPIEQRHHIAGIVRIARWHQGGKDKAGGRFRHNAGLTPKLGRAIALAFEDRGNGQIVGIDEFAMREFLALGEALGLFADLLFGAQGRAQRLGQALPLRGREGLGLPQELLSLLAERRDGVAERQQLAFGLAHQFHENVAPPPALAAKTPHSLFQLVMQVVGLRPQAGDAGAAALSDVRDEFQCFFWALYSWFAQMGRYF